MIHEDTGQLIADRFVNQYRRHCRIDPARQPADYLAVAHLGADFLDLGLAEFGHRPVTGQAADMAHEIGQQARAIGRVNHFGMELHGIDAAFIIRDDRIGRTGAGGDGAEAGRQPRHLVAMAHPHLMAFARMPQPVKQRTAFGNINEGAPEFAAVPGQNLAAQLVHQRLLAITDAENRQPAVQDCLRDARAVFIRDRCGAA